MFEVKVQSSFKAVHAIRLPNNELEPLHEHNWRVEVTFAGPQLDDNGVLIDFVAVQKDLDSVLDSLNGTNLNEHPFLAGKPSSAENVARRLFETISARNDRRAKLKEVQVQEAPGCSAIFRDTEGSLGSAAKEA